MTLKLNIYTDDTLSEIKRTAEADKLKIPYRVAMYVVQSMDSLDIHNDDDVLRLITSNVDKLDKIIKATFNVTDTELECVDLSDLSAVGMEIYKWVLDKFAGIKGGKSKNV